MTPTESGEQKHQSHAGKLILAVVVITLVAVLLVPGSDDQKPAPSQPVPADAPSLLEQQAAPPAARPDAGETTEATDETASRETAAPSPEPDTPDSESPVDDRPGAAARRLISELRNAPAPDLERAWQTAQTFEQNGKTDDALLLYFLAAREGHGPAALKLAHAADPASFREGGLFAHPDPLQAYKWYGRAASAGIDEARQAMAQLRIRTEQAAATGDEQAQRLMLQWK